jgi:transposase
MSFGSRTITEYEVKKWAKLFLEEHISLRDIAKMYNRSIPTIQRHLSIVGAYPKYKANKEA